MSARFELGAVVSTRGLILALEETYTTIEEIAETLRRPSRS